MRLTLAAVGRLKAGPDRLLFERYWERLQSSGRKVGITSRKLVELPESRAQTVAERKSDEAQRLLRAATADSAPPPLLIVLDEAGKSLSSADFAAFLGHHKDSGRAMCGILIGGPDGHGAEVLSNANLILSLGAMTLPHGLARILVAEQLYRATTILAGHPYHRS